MLPRRSFARLVGTAAVALSVAMPGTSVAMPGADAVPGHTFRAAPAELEDFPDLHDEIAAYVGVDLIKRVDSVCSATN